MSAQTSIGKLIDETEERDAIHIAIAPVVAGEKLAPGQGIALDPNDAEKVLASQAAIGIVDPFLTSLVFPGQRFFMFLLPNTNTSLRHNWTHPAFEAVKVKSDAKKMSSEDWLRTFLNDNGPRYEDLIAAVNNGGQFGRDEDGDYYNVRFEDEYIQVGGVDAHGDIPAEFWDHIEVVTGKKFEPGSRPAYFSCSC